MTWHREELPETLPAEPLAVVRDWLADATRLAVQPNPDAMTLATVDARGQPSARIVLCKEIAPDPGYITFYSNYRSRKGLELAANPRAAVVMHWDALHRQVRITGVVVEADAAASDAYFASRHWQSRLGAWASEQSAPVASRAALLRQVQAVAERFHLPVPTDEQQRDPGGVIPRPPHWGGYRLWAETVELWAEGGARIHDRAQWSRVLTLHAGAFTTGPWSATRLQP
jgi:pyridoxamine 5'-phosphate oxidase